MRLASTIILLLSCLLEDVLSYHMVCVYTNWSQYRPDKGQFLPENVDPSMCTHLIYVYAKLKGNRLEPSEWNDESTAWMEGMYSRVNNLKQINPDLKTLLGVGGWKMGSKDFSRMAARKSYRQLFARSAVEFLRDRDFDGLAVDWQYPTQRRGGRRLDKRNYSLLLKEIRQEFEKESKETGLPRLLLAAGVAASKQIVDSAYEVDKVSNHTDFLNVMAYDLHGSWDNYTGHPSPLFPRKDETGPQAENNVDTLMKYWVSKGADPGKLVLGVSTYGRTFTLQNKKFNGYGVPAKGAGDAGDYTRQEGMLAFYERCSIYFDATRVWDNYSKVPYWHSGQQWVGGEDTESIRAKVNWVHSNDIGGMMFWSLDMDDFDGISCGGGDFPLIRAAVDQFAAPVRIEMAVSKRNNTSVTKEIAQKPSNSTIKPPKVQSTLVPSSNVLSKQLKTTRLKDAKSNLKMESNLKESNLEKSVQQNLSATDIKTNEGKNRSNQVVNNLESQSTDVAKVGDKSEAVNKTKDKSINLPNLKRANTSPKGTGNKKQALHKENKSGRKNIKSGRKPLINPKRKQPQKGRRRKQWRRRRPPPRGRRRQRNRKTNKAKTASKTVKAKKNTKDVKTQPLAKQMDDMNSKPKPERMPTAKESKPAIVNKKAV